jgi:hypothetical protein
VAPEKNSHRSFNKGCNEEGVQPIINNIEMLPDAVRCGIASDDGLGSISRFIRGYVGTLDVMINIDIEILHSRDRARASNSPRVCNIDG